MSDDKPETKGKRRVRNPETFRERAVKAAIAQDKPQKKRPVRHTLKKGASPVGRFLVRLFQVQPFKTIGWLGKQIGKILVPKYFREAFKELKLVSWPNWQQSRKLTYAVLSFAVVFGTVIAVVDLGLDRVFKTILLK